MTEVVSPPTFAYERHFGDHPDVPAALRVADGHVPPLGLGWQVEIDIQ